MNELEKLAKEFGVVNNNFGTQYILLQEPYLDEDQWGNSQFEVRAVDLSSCYYEDGQIYFEVDMLIYYAHDKEVLEDLLENGIDLDHPDEIKEDQAEWCEEYGLC